MTNNSLKSKSTTTGTLGACFTDRINATSGDWVTTTVLSTATSNTQNDQDYAATASFSENKTVKVTVDVHKPGGKAAIRQANRILRGDVTSSLKQKI